MLVGLALAFAGLFLFVPPDASEVPGDELFEITAFMSGFTVVIPFVSLFLAVQAVSGDLEDRTCVYLFTRPVSRISVLLGKWLAVALLACLFATLAITALYLVIAHSGRIWEDRVYPTAASYLAILLSGWFAAVGYTAMGCLLGAFFKRPMLVSMVYIVVEQFASRLPPKAGIHSATVADPVRRFMDQSLDPPTRDLHEILTGRIAGEADAMLLGDPLASLGKLVVVTLCLALWIYSRREYESRPRE